MPITVSTPVGFAINAGAVTTTFSFTSTGDPLYVRVAQSGGVATVTGITYGGVALELVCRSFEAPTTFSVVEIWRLANPAAGTANVVGTVTATGALGSYLAANVAGVSATYPHGSVLEVVSTGSSLTTGPQPVNMGADDAVLSVCAIPDQTPNADPVFVATGGTSAERDSHGINGTHHGMFGKGTGPATTIAWTWGTTAASAWAMVGVVLHPAGWTPTAQRAAPTSESGVGSWTTDAGAATGLWSRIDEADPADDADYARSPVPLSVTPVGPTFGLSSVIDPALSTGYAISTRTKVDAVSDRLPEPTLRAELLQGGSPLSTPAVFTEAMRADWKTTEFALSAAQADAITNHGALSLKLEAAQAGPVWMAAVPAGVTSGTTAAITVPWPTTGTVNGDIGLLVVERAGGSAEPTLSTPAGFVAVTGGTASTGTGTAGTKCTVFWCRATGPSMASPVVAASADHQAAAIYMVRNAIGSGDPINAVGTAVKAAASTTATAASCTTTVPGCQVVMFLARDNDLATAVFTGTPAGGNLAAAPIKRFDLGTTSGLGGGFTIWTGVMPTAGATGAPTCAMTSGITASVTVAIAPPTPASRVQVSQAAFLAPSPAFYKNLAGAAAAAGVATGTLSKLAAVPAVSYSATVLADSPLGFWQLEDAGGSTATVADSSGNGRTGTRTPGTGPGYYSLIPNEPTGRSFFFGGYTNGAGVPVQAVNVPATGLTLGTGPGTLECWARLDGGYTGSPKIMGFGVNQAWSLFVDGATRNLSLFSFNGGIRATGYIVPVGQINHYVATVQPGGSIVVYVNGVAVYTVAYTAAVTNNALAFHIGQGGNDVDLWQGPIAKVAVYNTALSPARVLAHYTAANTPPAYSLRDDFDDNSIDTGKWTAQADAGTAVTETNQRLELSLSSAGVAYAGLTSTGVYSLYGSSVAVECVDPGTGGAGRTASLDLALDTSNVLKIIVDGPNVMAQTIIAGINTSFGTTAFGASHRWWRIREAGGSVSLETSPTGLRGTWTVLYSLDTPFALGSLTVKLFGGTYATVGSPGTVRFDNLNVPPGSVAVGVPSVDVATGKWTTSTGGTADLVTTIDEASPGSDTDYVQSEPLPQQSVYEIALGGSDDPVSSTGHVVSVRAGTDVANTTIPVTLRTELRQGDDPLSTPAVWTDTLTSTVQTFTHPLSAAQADAITDYRNLRLRFTAHQALAPPPQPAVAGAEAAATTATLAFTWPTPANVLAGDIAFLMVERPGGAATPTFVTPAGFVEIPGALSSTGTGINGTKIWVAWRRVTTGGAQANPTISASTDHQYGIIVTVRGAEANGDPFGALSTSTNDVANTTWTDPGFETLYQNSYVIQFIARDNDTAGAIFGEGLFPSNNLVNHLSWWDSGVISGNGGGTEMFGGQMPLPGPTGPTSADKPLGVTATTSVELRANQGPVTRAQISWAWLAVPVPAGPGPKDLTGTANGTAAVTVALTRRRSLTAAAVGVGIATAVTTRRRPLTAATAGSSVAGATLGRYTARYLTGATAGTSAVTVALTKRIFRQLTAAATGAAAPNALVTARRRLAGGTVGLATATGAVAKVSLYKDLTGAAAGRGQIGTAFTWGGGSVYGSAIWGATGVTVITGGPPAPGRVTGDAAGRATAAAALTRRGAETGRAVALVVAVGEVSVRRHGEPARPVALAATVGAPAQARLLSEAGRVVSAVATLAAPTEVLIRAPQFEPARPVPVAATVARTDGARGAELQRALALTASLTIPTERRVLPETGRTAAAAVAVTCLDTFVSGSQTYSEPNRALAVLASIAVAAPPLLHESRPVGVVGSVAEASARTNAESTRSVALVATLTAPTDRRGLPEPARGVAVLAVTAPTDRAVRAEGARALTALAGVGAADAFVLGRQTYDEPGRPAAVLATAAATDRLALPEPARPVAVLAAVGQTSVLARGEPARPVAVVATVAGPSSWRWTESRSLAAAAALTAPTDRRALPEPARAVPVVASVFRSDSVVSPQVLEEPNRPVAALAAVAVAAPPVLHESRPVGVLGSTGRTDRLTAFDARGAAALATPALPVQFRVLPEPGRASAAAADVALAAEAVSDEPGRSAAAQGQPFPPPGQGNKHNAREFNRPVPILATVALGAQLLVKGEPLRPVAIAAAVGAGDRAVRAEALRPVAVTAGVTATGPALLREPARAVAITAAVGGVGLPGGSEAPVVPVDGAASATDAARWAEPVGAAAAAGVTAAAAARRSELVRPVAALASVVAAASWRWTEPRALAAAAGVAAQEAAVRAEAAAVAVDAAVVVADTKVSPQVYDEPGCAVAVLATVTAVGLPGGAEAPSVGAGATVAGADRLVAAGPVALVVLGDATATARAVFVEARALPAAAAVAQTAAPVYGELAKAVALTAGVTPTDRLVATEPAALALLVGAAATDRVALPEPARAVAVLATVALALERRTLSEAVAVAVAAGVAGADRAVWAETDSAARPAALTAQVLASDQVVGGGSAYNEGVRSVSVLATVAAVGVLLGAEPQAAPVLAGVSAAGAAVLADAGGLGASGSAAAAEWVRAAEPERALAVQAGVAAAALWVGLEAPAFGADAGVGGGEVLRADSPVAVTGEVGVGGGSVARFGAVLALSADAGVACADSEEEPGDYAELDRAVAAVAQVVVADFLVLTEPLQVESVAETAEDDRLRLEALLPVEAAAAVVVVDRPWLDGAVAVDGAAGAAGASQLFGVEAAAVAVRCRVTLPLEPFQESTPVIRLTGTVELRWRAVGSWPAATARAAGSVELLVETPDAAAQPTVRLTGSVALLYEDIAVALPVASPLGGGLP